MSNREIAIELLNQIPDYKMQQIILILQGAAIADYPLNKETLESMDELENGGGICFSGRAKELFEELDK